MRIYEAVVKVLESVGVEAAFGGAGENDATLLLALKHSTKIKTVITRNEQAASFMACGYSMYTNKLGVCFATAGPGAFNLFSGLAVAMSDSHPILAISGYASLDWKGKGALNETSGVNGTPDSLAMFAATTKKAFFITDPNEICDVLEEAINVAFDGRPGPVHLTIPENLTHPHVTVDRYRDITLHIKPVRAEHAEISETASAVVHAIQSKKQMMLLIGYGAVQSNAGSELQTMVDRFQIPFATTLDGKGILPEDHPLALGVLATAGHRAARKYFEDTDVVIAVGNSFSQNGTFNFEPTLFDGKSLVHVNISRREINKVYPADHAVVSDAKPAIHALIGEISKSVQSVDPVNLEKEELRWDPILHLDNLIHPAELSQSLSNMLPDGSIVLADAGAHLAWLGYYLKLSRRQNYRKPGSFGPMACHVNGALGAKCAQPERTVIVGCGDGCYLLSGFELMTAVQYDIPVIWIIFNDGEFKLIKLYQEVTFHESGLVDFNNPDYVKYAHACGAEGYRVTTLEQFETAFQEALRLGRPTIIDAAITRLAIPHYSPHPSFLNLQSHLPHFKQS